MFKSTSPGLFKAKKTAVKQNVVKIIYPEFSGANETQEDEFWINELTKASQGEFPKGVTYTSQTLHYKRRGANQTLELRGVPEEIHSDYCRFMRQYLGILSPSDAEAERQLREEVGPVEYETWKDVPKRCKKELIWRYVNSFVPHLFQDRDRAEAMYQIITFGLSLKYIDPEDFELQNTKIIQINNLSYNKDLNRWFFIRNREIKAKAKAKPKIKQSDDSSTETELIKSYTQFLNDIMRRTSSSLVVMNKVPARYKESITMTPSGTRLSTLTDA